MYSITRQPCLAAVRLALFGEAYMPGNADIGRKFGRHQKEIKLRKSTFVLGALVTLALSSLLTETQPAAAADGCGAGRYRGPGGACHRFGYGPYPRGYYGPYRNAYNWNGCPAGYWHGPWGHCRDTPYHGRLPNGSWQ